MTSLSYFIQAPLLGFKEQERTHRVSLRFLVRVSPEGQSPDSTAKRLDDVNDRSHSPGLPPALQRPSTSQPNRSPLTPVPTSHSPSTPRKEALGGGLIDEPGGLWPNQHEKTRIDAVARDAPRRPYRCAAKPEDLTATVPATPQSPCSTSRAQAVRTIRATIVSTRKARKLVATQ